jgi:hypothetical protein
MHRRRHGPMLRRRQISKLRMRADSMEEVRWLNRGGEVAQCLEDEVAKCLGGDIYQGLGSGGLNRGCKVAHCLGGEVTQYFGGEEVQCLGGEVA